MQNMLENTKTINQMLSWKLLSILLNSVEFCKINIFLISVCCKILRRLIYLSQIIYFTLLYNSLCNIFNFSKILYSKFLFPK